MNYRSIADLNNAIIRGLSKIPRDVDLVVGVPRSGLMAASLAALHLNLPLTDVEGVLEGRIIGSGQRQISKVTSFSCWSGKHLLVLDDSVHSGNAMREAKGRLAALNEDVRITYAAVYVAPRGKQYVDLYFEEVIPPRVFEWNFLHRRELAECCLDIDGVLCRDPTKEENDDGERYRDFLQNVEPFLVPSVPVGWLVTNRLEKYRSLTEEWLGRHGVEYQELRMLDLPSKEARLAANCHASFKAEAYKETRAFLFIESDLGQSREVARLSGRPVLCIATRQMVYPGAVAHFPVFLPKASRFVARRLGKFRKWVLRRVFRFDPPTSI